MGNPVTTTLAIMNPVTAAQIMIDKKAAEEGVKKVDEATGAKAARDQQTELARRQQERQDQLEAEAKQRAQDEEGTAAAQATREQARARQRALAASAQGRSSTLLTGPLGVTGSATGAGKTLLGA